MAIELSAEADEGLIELAAEMQVAMAEAWRAGRYDPDADGRPEGAVDGLQDAQDRQDDDHGGRRAG